MCCDDGTFLKQGELFGQCFRISRTRLGAKLGKIVDDLLLVLLGDAVGRVVGIGKLTRSIDKRAASKSQILECLPPKPFFQSVKQ